MKSSTQIILAIVPGKREFGVAVFNGIELVYFAVRSLRNRRDERLLKNEINELIQRLVTVFKPQVIVVKVISQYQKTSVSLGLIDKLIRRKVSANRIPLVDVSIEQIKAALCRDEKPTLKKAFQNLTVLYPELKQYLNRPNRWQTEYYHSLFSAVAVGAAYLNSRVNKIIKN
jgi:RNase H-fold protein (predicted Holliday junction resolvase)